MTELAIKAFRNPFATIGTMLTGLVMGMIAMGEQAGRSRAAAELARQGYYDEARALILGKSIEDVDNVQLERTFQNNFSVLRDDDFLSSIPNFKRIALRRSYLMWPYTQEEADEWFGK